MTSLYEIITTARRLREEDSRKVGYAINNLKEAINAAKETHTDKDAAELMRAAVEVTMLANQMQQNILTTNRALNAKNEEIEGK